MNQPNKPIFDQVLSDARALLREDEIQTAKESIEQLAPKCLENPMLLYSKNAYRPRFVVWELTLRCNMRCAHCGSAAGERRGDELDTEEALDLADQLGALGCERLTLLGGEPLVREDWEQLTARLQKAGVRVNIISNGWLTADRLMVQRIKDAGLTTLALSIDGYAKGHDELRRRENSFARILKTYELAHQVGYSSLAAVTTITKMVIDHLEELYKVLVESGVRLWQIQLCTPQGRMERGDPLLPDASDIRRVADFIVLKKGEGKLRIDPADNIGYYGKWELDDGFRSSQWGRVSFWNGCQAGCQVAGIEANGDIKGCLSLPSDPIFIEGNVRQETLSEIWWNEGNFAYNREFQLDMLASFCASCKYRGLCRAGCVSHAYCKNGHRGNNTDCLYRLTQEGKP